MTNETRQQMIARLIDERARAEAERYKDKQMDEPRGAGVLVVKHPIGTRVRLKLDQEGAWGYVTGVTLRQAGVYYLATWGDSRGETPYCDFELTTEDQDYGGGLAYAESR